MVDQGPAVDAQCPTWAASLGYMGVAAAVCLSNWGSAVSNFNSCLGSGFSIVDFPLATVVLRIHLDCLKA